MKQKTKEEILTECFEKVKKELSGKYIHGGKIGYVMPIAFSLAFDKYAEQHTELALRDSDSTIDNLTNQLISANNEVSRMRLALEKLNEKIAICGQWLWVDEVQAIATEALTPKPPKTKG